MNDKYYTPFNTLDITFFRSLQSISVWLCFGIFKERTLKEKVLMRFIEKYNILVKIYIEKYKYMKILFIYLFCNNLHCMNGGFNS